MATIGGLGGFTAKAELWLSVIMIEWHRGWDHDRGMHRKVIIDR
jgi:hypothetical protein